MMRRGVISACVILTVATAALAASPADLMKTRHQNFKVMGKAFKGIMDELKRSAPSVPSLQAKAKVITGFAPKVPTWFPAGTGPETGVKTEALPAIWQKQPEFLEAAKNMALAADKLNTVAAGGDVAQISAAARGLGGTCKSCHDRFRLKD